MNVFLRFWTHTFVILSDRQLHTLEIVIRHQLHEQIIQNLRTGMRLSVQVNAGLSFSYPEQRRLEQVKIT